MSDAGLHDRPVLVLDPGMHTAPISRADVDRAGRFAVTASDDKTVRVWSLADGRLLAPSACRPAPADVGKVYAVAISPDGATIAAGGWTRWSPTDPQEQIYLFDRDSGAMTGRIDGPSGRGRRSRLLAGRRPAGGSARCAVACGSTRATAPEPLDRSWRRTTTTATQAMVSPSPPTVDWRPRVAMVGCGSMMRDGELLRSIATPARPALRPRLQPGGRPAGGRLQ